MRTVAVFSRQVICVWTLGLTSLTQGLFQLSLPAPNDAPSRSSTATGAQRRSHLGVRRFALNQIHMLIFTIMHGIFSLYIKLRQFWNVVCYQTSSVLYYHHGTPQYIQRDVMGLEKKPKHLSAVLKMDDHPKAKADLERLIDQTAELATWCACADIPTLSVYEKTGKDFSYFVLAKSMADRRRRRVEETHASGLRGSEPEVYLLFRRTPPDTLLDVSPQGRSLPE